jgi:hypothetical protein
MRTLSPLGFVFVVLAGAAVTACDSGGGGPEESPHPNYVRLQSDAGDYIGAGLTYEYTQADALIYLTAGGGELAVQIDGDERWFGDFQVPDGFTRLEPGMYSDLQRAPFHDPAKGGLDWSGEGRGCNTLTGWFDVDSVTYLEDALAAVDLRFEQHCEGGAPALHGTIHWRSDDPTRPAGPVNPIPSGLWRPAPGSTPSTGSFVYLKSDVGDFIGGGQTLTHTPADATIVVAAVDGHLAVSVDGAHHWTGDFLTMISLSELQPGYYGNLQRYPFHNPAKGGLDWSGDGKGCNTLTGWFAVENVAYLNGNLAAIDMRFEQHCEGGDPALHGAIHWAE